MTDSDDDGDDGEPVPEWLEGDDAGGEQDGGGDSGGRDGDPEDGESAGGDAGDDGGWNPDDPVDGEFVGEGASGGAVDVVAESGETLTEEYWFEGERTITTPQGTPLLYALSAAGLYASSFIFAAIGVFVVAPDAAVTYLGLVRDAVFFFPIPIAAFLAAGVAIEAYLYVGEGDVPETTIPLALLIPVLLHVSLFFVEFVEVGVSQATLADLFAENPTFSQLLLWPPVIMGTIFAVIVYRTTVAERAREEESEGLFEFA